VKAATKSIKRCDLNWWHPGCGPLGPPVSKPAAPADRPDSLAALRIRLALGGEHFDLYDIPG